MHVRVANVQCTATITVCTMYGRIDMYTLYMCTCTCTIFTISLFHQFVFDQHTFSVFS